MDKIIKQITVDLMKPGDTPTIHAVQGEYNIRGIQLILLNEGIPWQVPTDALVTVRYGRINLTGGYYDTLPDGSKAWSIENNTVKILFAPNMMSAAGTVFTQVEILYRDQMLVTFPLRLLVVGNPALDVVDEEMYINCRQWVEKELDAYIEKVKESAEFLGGTMAGPIHMNGHKLNGLNIPTENNEAATKGYTLGLVRKATPDNRFDNSNFRNPVNQRGSTVYTQGYAIDRWMIWDDNSGGKLALTENGIRITPGTRSVAIVQRIPIERIDTNKTYSFVAYLSNGVMVVQHRTLTDSGNGYTVFEHYVDEETVFTHFALYEGEYTLETLPEYHAKEYGAELLECKRYYQKYEDKWFAALMNGSGFCLHTLILPVQMRIAPTANYGDNSEALFDVYGVGTKTLLYEYFNPKVNSLYFAVKSEQYANYYITPEHTLTLDAEF